MGFVLYVPTEDVLRPGGLFLVFFFFSGKRPMPKQVADINVMMSPNSSLDLSVCCSPRKNNTGAPFVRLPATVKVSVISLDGKAQPFCITPMELELDDFNNSRNC